MRVAALLVALVVPVSAAAAQGTDSVAPPRTVLELEARIRDVLAETHTPAIGIALVTRDSALWIAGLGIADVASGRPATDHTLFRIGSTSKAFVSLLALQLEEQGVLSLDDPVRARAPEIAFANRWEATHPVRIVHLLEHAAGWDDLALRDYATNDPSLTLRAGLDANPKTRTSRWRPGTRVSYCNSGPGVAAYIAERVTGQPFEDLVRERLFRPIGMTTATYLVPDPPEALATLYHTDGVTPFPYWHILQRPAGAINASARDMAAYVRFLLNRGTVAGRQVVPTDAVVRMERPRSSLTARSGLALGYGLHLSTYVDSQFVWVGHDGGVAGGLTMMGYRPDQSVGFAFMINSGSGEALRQISRLVRDFLTRDAAVSPPPTAPISDLARARAGWYRADNPRVQGLYFIERIFGVVRLRTADSVLLVRPLTGKTRRFVPVDERRFRQPFEPAATLALVDDGDNGRPAAIELMGYLLPTSLRRVPAWTVWVPVVVGVVFALGSVVTVLFALLWGARLVWRRVRRRPTAIPHLAVRLWPLVALLMLGGFYAVIALSLEEIIPRFGAPTVWSIGALVCSTLFPIAAAGGVIAVLRAPRATTGRVTWWYGAVVSTANLIVAAYLVANGIFAWRSWA